MGGPQSGTGHSPEWQRAYLSAGPEDSAQNQLVSQLALPIGDAQTREQAQRVNALRSLFSRLDSNAAKRLYDRLSNSGDSLGQLFYLTLHHSTRAELTGVLDAARRSHDRGIGPDSRATDDGKTLPPGPSPVPTHTLQPKQPQPPPKQPTPTGPATPVPPPPPPPWWLPWLTDPPQKPIAPPPAGPGIISRLTKLTGHGAAMLGGLMLGLPASVVAAAIAAALEALVNGETFGRAGEMAAKEVLKWQLEHKGLSGHVLDLNKKPFRKNFPGIDLMSSVRPWQVKMWGVTAKGSKFDVAMSIANAMAELYGGGIRLPNTTANALFQFRELIIKENAWPSSWPTNPTLDQLKVLIQDTAFAVPNDLVGRARSAFGKRLIEDPKLRELIPELKIGSLNDPKTLAPSEQARWAQKVENFLFTHVQPVGLTTDQMRKIIGVAQELRNVP